VLLLDEPLGALDKKLREEMQLELRALQESVGITFVFVTHDQEEALTLSDRIAVMSGGKALQVASPKDLYNRPVSVEVASFIGQMNFTDARVSELRDGRAILETARLGTVRAAAGSADFVRKGAEIVLAIRPEKLVLSRNRAADGAQSIAGVLKTAAYLGDRSQFYVLLQGDDKPLAVAAQETDSTDYRFERDSPVWVSWREEALILLPKP
jgi:spermidine/putrescine transport system ATP-binding protein/putrescine transport system ATP-binding protein